MILQSYKEGLIARSARHPRSAAWARGLGGIRPSQASGRAPKKGNVSFRVRELGLFSARMMFFSESILGSPGTQGDLQVWRGMARQ